MKEECKLFNYTYNNVAAHLLNVRIPYFTSAQLTRWYSSNTNSYRTIRYLHQLTVLNLQLLDGIDHIRRTSECARLYGIDYTSVLTRGSQYRVEASLVRKARREGYLLLSPTRTDVAKQAPMQVIPLVMEPVSQFYADPVVVLDFQSLYPSMILAYNLCFSTIMGKMRPGCPSTYSNTSSSGSSRDSRGNTSSKNNTTTATTTKAPTAMENDTTEHLGVTAYPESTAVHNASLHSAHIPYTTTTTDPIPLPNETNKHAYISPNGASFCSKSIRLGILPQMVSEMLSTRVMVKRSMKVHKSENRGDVLQKVLEARQLAIKLLSNVTCKCTIL